MLQEVAALEVGIGMDNGIQVRLVPRPVVLDFFDFCFVRPLEDPIAGDMVPSLANVFSHSSEHFFVVHACGLEKSHEVVDRVVAVRTAMRLTNARVGIAEDFLARIRRISSALAVDIATHITVSVPDIVLVSGIELVVCEALEGLSPENNTFLEREPNSLQEQCILKSAEMLQMVVLAE